VALATLGINEAKAPEEKAAAFAQLQGVLDAAGNDGLLPQSLTELILRCSAVTLYLVEIDLTQPFLFPHPSPCCYSHILLDLQWM